MPTASAIRRPKPAVEASATRRPKPAVKASATARRKPAVKAIATRRRKPAVKASATRRPKPAVKASATRRPKPAVKASASRRRKPAVKASASRRRKPAVKASATRRRKPAVEASATRRRKPAVKASATRRPKPAVKASATRRPKPAVKASAQETDGGARRYIYAIINCDGPTNFGPLGIGTGRPEVFTVAHEGIAAVVSRTPIEKFEISRENTIVHQRVMEAAMEGGHTVLPVRFNTIAEDKPDGAADAESRILSHVLTKRKDEFCELLATYRTRDELGVKGLWPNVQGVFDDIVETNDKIRAFRDRLLASSRLSRGRKRRGHVTILDGKPKLGEMVKNALDVRKLAIQRKLRRRLSDILVDVVENKTFGDPMFTNLAVLVERSRTEELDAALSAFEDEQAGEVKLRYVGPVPPSNFIEVVIVWDD